ncbi:hypothetical protein KY290_017505 [Solanum tuberosum]|uniref:Uncharacterized protein n=1 Tax=Solanum tuberosum TaxID=4113 RepID=A0ABQ7VBF4_SOLTU|nr:hypothetical protein KY285_035493 [Solanum tuberosum]KAH0682830.1 hypothetical protein KY289_020582 [Solanum tuberosum]KAH0695927.1 hypothetical protein KY289_013409 [Solanum tuberosum]KAH0706451.1 hypothetical protein KY289_011527 [Solanum tuberosum]KAH0712947.1 hypothetical protein KY289_008906 [Solanum tuberosum]
MEVLAEMEATPVGMEAAPVGREARDLLLLGVTPSAAAATSSAAAKEGGCGGGWRRGAGRRGGVAPVGDGWWGSAPMGWVRGGSAVGSESGLGFES